MGKERFGLLAIIWMGVGYFSLFDMGLGRALTKLVAERLSGGQLDELGALIWTAMGLVAFMSILGSLLVLAGAGPLIRDVLNVDAQLHIEAINALQILAMGLPIVILSAALIGLLEAHQRFASITLVRIPLGVLTFVGPLIALQYSPSLVWATVTLLVARCGATIAYFFLAAGVRPEIKKPQWPLRVHMRPLFHFGGWLTVTNIVGPLMVYFDRFLIGSIMTMTAVTYYVTPYEVISRMQMLPQSIVSVLFPALAIAIAGERSQLLPLYTQTSKILFVLMLPLTAGFFLLAPEALELWLGTDFRENSVAVVQWLALGLLINTLAKAPLTALQSAGRPDLVAKAHLGELVPYALLLWSLTSMFGIAGTAAAWTLRVLVDTLLLNEMARYKLPEIRSVVFGTYGLILLVLTGFGVGWMISTLLWRGLLLLLVVAYSAYYARSFIQPLILAMRQRQSRA